MIFARIAGSVSRSARSRLQSNRFSGYSHGRIPLVTESCLEAKPCVNGGLGFATAYLRSNGVGAGNQIVRRLFSTESPEKRNYDIYYYSSDTMKKKIIPRTQEPESKSESESDDSQVDDWSDFLRKYLAFTFIYYLHEDVMEMERKIALDRAKQQRDSEDIQAAGRWENEENQFI